jgi:chemotaxis protein MotA
MTLAGFLGAVVLLTYGIWHEGAMGAFANSHGIILVIGGTLCATMINSSVHDMLNAFKAGFSLLGKPKYIPPDQVLPLVSRLATKARQAGKMALESEKRSVADDGFLERVIDIAMTTNDETLARLTLEEEVVQIKRRHQEVGNVFRTAGLLGPMFGLLGTLIGIISVLRNISDPESVGPAMAVAISSAFYGILLANLFCVPAAGKLRSRSLEELLSKEILLEGLMDIFFSDRIPTMIEMRLVGYLKAGKVRREEGAPRTAPLPVNG